jgi:hypothetical protein
MLPWSISEAFPLRLVLLEQLESLQARASHLRTHFVSFTSSTSRRVCVTTTTLISSTRPIADTARTIDSLLCQFRVKESPIGPFSPKVAFQLFPHSQICVCLNFRTRLAHMPRLGTIYTSHPAAFLPLFSPSTSW